MMDKRITELREQLALANARIAALEKAVAKLTADAKPEPKPAPEPKKKAASN